MEAGDDRFEVGHGVDALEAAAVDEGVEYGGVLASDFAAHEEEILAADGDGSLDVFTVVVVDRPVAGFGEAVEFGPLIGGVDDGLGEQGAFDASVSVKSHKIPSHNSFPAVSNGEGEVMIFENSIWYVL